MIGKNSSEGKVGMMKRIVQIKEVEGQGMEALLGQKVTFFCMNYIYSGVLSGVNEHDVILDDAYLVYETGAFDAGVFKDAQKLGKEWRLRTDTIESYGVINNK